MSLTDIFIEKATSVHAHKYCYHHVQYVNAKSKVAIYCYEHGIFYQTPNNHLRGQGCPECALSRKLLRIKATALTNTEFISRARLTHVDKYNYTKTMYVAGNKPVVITCKEHGDFMVKRAEKHLIGQGCPTCSRRGSLAEEIIKNWLSAKGVQFFFQYTFDDCVSPYTKRKLVFDFYIPHLNAIIEYDGEQHTKKSPLFHTGDKFERLTEYDAIKTNYALKHNIWLIRINHNEFNEIVHILDQHIK